MTSTSASRVPRMLLLVAIVLAVVGVSAFFTGRVAKRTIEARIERAASARGIGVTIEKTSLSFLLVPTFSSLCLSFLDDGENDVCFDHVRTPVRFRGLLQGSASLRAVTIDYARVRTSTERLETLRARLQTEGSQANEGEQSLTGGVLRHLASVVVEGGEVALTSGNNAVNATLIDFQAVAHDAWVIHAAGTLDAASLESESLQRVANALLQNALHVEAAITPKGEVLAANLLLDRPFETAFQAYGEAHRVSLREIQFAPPYTIRLTDLRASAFNNALQAHIGDVSVDIGTWTTDLAQFYLSAIRIDAPTVYSTRAELERIYRQRLRDRGQGDAPQANDAPTPEEEDASARSFRARLEEELRHRKWHDALPRAIHITHAQGHIVAALPTELADAQTLDALEKRFSLVDAELDYGLRVLQRQLDVRARAALLHQGEPTGALMLQGEWEYDKKRAKLQWGATLEDLNVFERFTQHFGVHFESGALHGAWALNGTKRDGFTLTSDLTVTDARLALRKLKEAIDLPRIHAETTLVLLRKGDGELSVETRANAIQVGEAKVELLVHADRLRLKGPHFAQRVQVQWAVPDQDPMALLHAFPEALQGPLVGTQMAGTFGQTLHFDVLANGVNEHGKGLWAIQAPSRSEFRDQNLRLVQLPNAVDVRRLNASMRFVFRGPDDRIMRTLTLAPPAPYRSYSTITIDSAGERPARWLRLGEISWPLVATQLYREDMTFFTNTGINWLQLRNVLSEALTTGRLSRGASTISMQLIKNIFLSHERSIERKLHELFLTYWLTRLVPKERILEVYLNVIELGPNINGVEEAAQFYFHDSARTLPVLESTWLSSISPNPTRLGGGRYRGPLSPGTCTRCDRLVEALITKGWLTREEAPRAVAPSEAPTLLPGFDEADAQGASPLLQLLDAVAPEERASVHTLHQLPAERRVRALIDLSRLPRGAN